VTVISYQLWKGHFKNDPQIIGKTQRLSGTLHTIVGVMPEGFYGTFVGWAMQFWVPASMEETFEAGGYKLEDRGARWIEAYVRLKPGVNLRQAQEEISAVAARLESAYPDTNRGRGIRLWPLWQTPFNSAGTLLPTLEIMLVVVVFVLLIACANVGNLLLVRSFARRHEMTVRMAIGAGRGRLVKQLVTEGLVLQCLARSAGCLLRTAAVTLLFPARRRDDAPSGGNRWASAGVERRSLFVGDARCRSGPRNSDAQARSRRRVESRLGRRCRWSWKSVGAFGTCAGSRVAEFRIAGWSGIAATEPAA
jgi:hypothetical protein